MRNQILFTKYSNERSEKFSIRTQIISDENNTKYIVKYPMTDKAVDHVNKMLKWEKALNQIYEGSGLSMNKCSKCVDGVRFEFLNGKTLESELDAFLEKKNIDGCLERIAEYISIVRKAKNQFNFYMTEEFKEVFGNVDLSNDLMCSPVTDIDMLFGNVMIVDGNMQLIDYEWTFEFPIPINFIIFRAIHYYSQLGNCRPLLNSIDLYEKFGISNDEKIQYECMEKNFQRYITEGMTPIHHLYDCVSPGCVQVSKFVSEHRQKQKRNNLQIFWDIGNGYSEKNSVKFPLRGDGEFDIKFVVPEGTVAIRLDPGEDSGILHIEKLQLNDENVVFAADGWMKDEETIIYVENDPKVFIEQLEREPVVLYFKGCMHTSVDEYAKCLSDILKESSNKEEQVQQLKKEVEKLSWNVGDVNAENNRLKTKISEIENTKIWKFYRKYKSIVSK